MKTWLSKASFISVGFAFFCIIIDYSFGFLYFSSTSALVVGVLSSYFLESIMSNLYGRTIIMVMRPFSIGDAILMPSCKIDGFVERVNLFSTHILTAEKIPVVLPNRYFIKNYVENISRSLGRRIRITCPIEADVDTIRRIRSDLQNIIMQQHFLDESQVTVLMRAIGNRHFQLILAFFIKPCSTLIMRDIQQPIMSDLCNFLVSNGIKFAMPVVQVELISD